jgi:hypothetical protein
LSSVPAPAPAPRAELLRREIEEQLSAGVPFEQVESEVIDRSPLDWQVKAALWLYGWSFVEQPRQRAEAVTHLALLGALE